MTIYDYIKNALTQIKFDADIRVLDAARTETELLDIDKPVIIINPDFSGSIELSKGAELLNITKYKVRFLAPDEWDTPDFSEIEANTMQVIESMKNLMNSVFFHIFYLPENQFRIIGNVSFRWTFEPVYRKTNSTVSGVEATINFPLIDSLTCNYE